MLIAFLENNADLARGLLQTENARRSGEVLWEETTNKLNSEGPPTRNKNEWKKVLYIAFFWYILYFIFAINCILCLGVDRFKI